MDSDSDFSTFSRLLLPFSKHKLDMQSVDASAAAIDEGPWLSLIVRAKNGTCDVGACILRERPSKWDDEHIQSQLGLKPGQLSEASLPANLRDKAPAAVRNGRSMCISSLTL